MPVCPTDQELRAYLCGAVSVAEQESLAGHLDSCPGCLHRLDTLGDPGDPLVGALRGAPSNPTPLEPAVLKVLGEPAADGPPTAVGDRFGPYVLLEKLGEGGMGAVYKVRHDKLGKVFALKILPGGRGRDTLRAARFEREVRAVGRLEHPHIVRATDAGEHDGAPFLVMELVDGIDLARFVRRRGPLGPADACEVIRQAALALQHAHDRGLIHRDVKPSNLLLTPDGTVKLLDLGLALATGEPEAPAAPRAPGDAAPATLHADGPTLTLTGLALGTRDYMAPEQAAAPHAVDARADVYGLGTTLHYLLSGRPPGAGVPLPPALAGVLARMLARRPEERFASAREVAAAVARRAKGHHLPTLLTGQRPRARRWWVTAAGVAGVLAVGGLVVAGVYGNRRPEPEPVAAVAALVPQPPAPAPSPTPPPPPAPEPPPPPAAGFLPMTMAEAQKLQQDWADYLGQPVEVGGPAGVKTVLVPPGEFQLYPRYHVTISKPYRLGTTEVTRGQFRAFVTATKYVTTGELAGPFKPLGVVIGAPKDTGNWRDPGYPFFDDDYPVTHVSHMDAEAFVEWLTKTEGKTYRLPTEAEWRWACRAGATTRYPFGPDPRPLAEYAAYKGTTRGYPSPAGGRRPNAWGLRDQLGNVKEWVADGHTPFREGAFTDPVVGSQPGGMRVSCGGSYDGRTDIPDAVGWHSATCDCNTRTGRHWYICSLDQGFRVCREP